MQKLRLVEINRWFFIKHSTRGKYYKFKYWKVEPAREQLISLEEDWFRNTNLENKQVTDDFHVGYGKCEPVLLRGD